MAKKKKASAADQQKPSLETAMEELTQIVAELESGQQPLSDALQKFERGMELMRECDRELEEAAGRIEIVRRVTDDGVETTDFDSTATVDRKSENGGLF